MRDFCIILKAIAKVRQYRPLPIIFGIKKFEPINKPTRIFFINYL